VVAGALCQSHRRLEAAPRVETLPAGSQADVGRVGRLRLHADEAIDGLFGGQRVVAKQQLSRECRPVQPPQAEDIRVAPKAAERQYKENCESLVTRFDGTAIVI
jgi:hypothetical protein